MIKPSKRPPDLSQNKRYCECRPVCKNRRRLWRGHVQKTSAELILEDLLRKSRQTELIKDRPEVPCDLWAKREDGTTPFEAENYEVTICDNPIANSAASPCLDYAKLARSLGAWNNVKAKCAFCSCRGCCQCQKSTYQPVAESEVQRRRIMSEFDRRVKNDCQPMRIMYSKI